MDDTMIHHYIIIYIYTWNPNDPCFDWKRPSFGGFKPEKKGPFRWSNEFVYFHDNKRWTRLTYQNLGDNFRMGCSHFYIFCWWQFVIWKHIVLYNKLLVFMLLCRKQTILYKLLCNYLHVCLLLTILFFFFCSLLIRYSNLPKKTILYDKTGVGHITNLHFFVRRRVYNCNIIDQQKNIHRKSRFSSELLGKINSRLLESHSQPPGIGMVYKAL